MPCPGGRHGAGGAAGSDQKSDKPDSAGTGLPKPRQCIIEFCGPAVRTIHADLFRDNVVFDLAQGEAVLSGFFDFYFAGDDTWVFDLAVCLNDWCIDLPTHTHQALLAHSFIKLLYNTVRPLQRTERELLPAMLRAAALRFGIHAYGTCICRAKPAF